MKTSFSYYPSAFLIYLKFYLPIRIPIYFAYDPNLVFKEKKEGHEQSNR